ncbi:hypothetical protein P4H42_18500 [Paenibacillus macerans]|uniref:hypothetical protein n=1 Tax=Paenibacillus macerans TaxID=44252 RepID=UPI002DB9636C|nr:hypothetical protein [Paenibacillus macerans]MEC0331608.1 hypothetical protein [Paenibacillus macerans]
MKKWRSIAATAAALSLMFTAVPIHAEEQLSQSVEQNGQTAPNIDQAVSDKLTDALNKLAPNSKITFTSVDENLWVFEGTLSGKTEASFSQLYNPEKNRVESTSIIYKADDMDKVMDKTLSSRVTSFLKTFDTDKKFKPEALWRSYSPYQEDKQLRNYWVFFGNAQNLYIDLDNNNAIKASISYSLKSANTQLNNKASRALKELGISSTKPFNFVTREKEGDKKFIWNYQDDNDFNHVLIGAKTGKVWEVLNITGEDWTDEKDFAKSFAKPKLSKAKALSVAKPAVQSIFSINLKGYSVTIKANEYTFTKKGAPTLVGKINKKGKFYSWQQIPANGVMS